MRLVYEKTRKPVMTGDEVTLRDGVKGSVYNTYKPNKPSSTGKVEIMTDEGHKHLFYPSVIGAEWIERPDHNDIGIIRKESIISISHQQVTVDLRTLLSVENSERYVHAEIPGTDLAIYMEISPKNQVMEGIPLEEEEDESS